MEVFDGAGEPCAPGIYTDRPVDCARGDPAAVLRRIAARVRDAARAGRVPVVLGGEHTVTLGAVRGLLEAGRPFGVLQFDAHADLRDAYEGSPFSHACVMRRIHEQGVPFVQFAVRALSFAEHGFRVAHRIAHHDMAEMAEWGVPRRPLPRGFPRQVYVTFDVDAFDPAVLPATGTPDPGGLSWYDAVRLLRVALRGREIIGFDVVELAPAAGQHASDFTAAKLVYHLMSLAQP